MKSWFSLKKEKMIFIFQLWRHSVLSGLGRAATCRHLQRMSRRHIWEVYSVYNTWRYCLLYNVSLSYLESLLCTIREVTISYIIWYVYYTMSRHICKVYSAIFEVTISYLFLLHNFLAAKFTVQYVKLWYVYNMFCIQCLVVFAMFTVNYLNFKCNT